MTYGEQLYYIALRRAEYYIWSALRGNVIPGSDPTSGLPSDRCRWTVPGWKEASREAYKALGRFWLQRAADIRRGVDND